MSDNDSVINSDKATWTEGPAYPRAMCRRCGAALDLSAMTSGWCWRCGDMGAVELEEDD